jgi:hypothetical protein
LPIRILNPTLSIEEMRPEWLFVYPVLDQQGTGSFRIGRISGIILTSIIPFPSFSAFSQLFSSDLYAPLLRFIFCAKWFKSSVGPVAARDGDTGTDDI